MQQLMRIPIIAIEVQELTSNIFVIFGCFLPTTLLRVNEK
jgi:hypothetical protein